jgi:hypothetical protein
VVNKDKTIAISLGYSGEVAEIFDPITSQLLAKLPHPGTITGDVFVTSSRQLLTSAADGIVRLWSLERIIGPPARPKLRLASGVRRGLTYIPKEVLLDPLFPDIDRAISIDRYLTDAEVGEVDAGSRVLRGAHPPPCYKTMQETVSKSDARLFFGIAKAERS